MTECSANDSNKFFDKFDSLHTSEELLRQKAQAIVSKSTDYQLHLSVAAAAMDVTDLLRHFGNDDQDFRAVQMLGMRVFNAFASSIKLSFSGYHQNAILILRDVMETVFLMDLFQSDRTKIQIWRYADKKTWDNEFSPLQVRKKLDNRDGHQTSKRKQRYKLFSDLAAHPSMKSAWMLCPEKNGDAKIGPFVEHAPLGAVLFEMGRLAAEAIHHFGKFLPTERLEIMLVHIKQLEIAEEWMQRFYGREYSKAANSEA